MATYKSNPGSNGSFAMDKFVPAIWSSRILKNLHDKQILASLCTREYEGEIKGKGDTVYVHGVGAVAVRPYITNLSTGDAVTYDTLTDGRITVEVDTAEYFAFKVEDIEQAQASPKFVSEASQEAAIALAKSSDNYCYNKLYTSAVNDTADDFGQRGATSTTNGGVITADLSTYSSYMYDALVDCGVRLDDMLCPDDGRYVVIPSFAKGAVLKDDRFVANNSAGQATMRDKGKIGNIAGFEVYVMPRSTFVRWDDSGASNLHETTYALADLGVVTEDKADDYGALFGRKGAEAFVDQINKVENLRLEGFFADAVRGLHMYGHGSIRPQFTGVLAIDDPAA